MSLPPRDGEPVQPTAAAANGANEAVSGSRLESSDPPATAFEQAEDADSARPLAPHFRYETHPDAIQLQKELFLENYQRWAALLAETQTAVRRSCEETIATLQETPDDLERIRTAAQSSSAAMFLHLAARGFRRDADTNHRSREIAIARILRGVTNALDSGDVKHLQQIAKVAEPNPRDAHATPRSETRTRTIEWLYGTLCGKLARLWGLETVDDLVAQRHQVLRDSGYTRENVERNMRAAHAEFMAAPANDLARAFVEHVQLMPEIFVDRGVQFSTLPRYDTEGAEVLGPDPERVALVEVSYRKKLENWDATVDEERIRDRAIDLIEEGLVALGMDRKSEADSVVSFLRKRADGAARA